MPQGAYPRKSPQERFALKVVVAEDGCHIWKGCMTRGYGRFGLDGHLKQAHRVAWEWAHGTILPGLQIDHLCCNPSCVNPAHMEPVTPRVNTLRGQTPAAANAAKTHCPQGHAYSEHGKVARWRGRQSRQCVPCHADAQRRYRGR